MKTFRIFCVWHGIGSTVEIEEESRTDAINEYLISHEVRYGRCPANAYDLRVEVWDERDDCWRNVSSRP